MSSWLAETGNFPKRRGLDVARLGFGLVISMIGRHFRIICPKVRSRLQLAPAVLKHSKRTKNHSSLFVS